jgi:hypothetical protein
MVSSFFNFGKVVCFQIVILLHAPQQSLDYKEEFKAFEIKHCMQGCQDICAFVTMRQMHLDVKALPRHINIVNLGQWDFWVAQAKLMGDQNYVCFCHRKAYNDEKISIVLGLAMEIFSSHSLGQSKHFHQCMLGN